VHALDVLDRQRQIVEVFESVLHFSAVVANQLAADIHRMLQSIFESVEEEVEELLSVLLLCGIGAAIELLEGEAELPGVEVWPLGQLQVRLICMEPCCRPPSLLCTLTGIN
jgi:hypothetical protein